MAKQSGLGDNLYVQGRNISGDVGSLGSVSGGNAPLEVTGIDKSAMERLGGLRNGSIEFTSFFNTSSLQQHSALSGLSTSNRHAMYTRGTSIGDAAAAMVCKQINYDPTRGADGSLTFNVSCLSDQFGLEWGQLLTAGVRTDTAATNGASVDTTASLSFGGQAYLQVFNGFAGTDATVKIQDSADNAAFADVATWTLATVTVNGPDAFRVAISNTATIRRYVRVVTTTSAGFTNLSYAVMFVKNEIASQVF